MNELQAHEDFVTLHPENRWSARALVDHVEELLELDHVTALKYVARLRRTARNAEERSAATSLLKHTSRQWRELLNAVCAATALQNTDNGAVYVVSGSRPPFLHTRRNGQHSRWFGMYPITVGARWVIRKAAELDELDQFNTALGELVDMIPEPQ